MEIRALIKRVKEDMLRHSPDTMIYVSQLSIYNLYDYTIDKPLQNLWKYDLITKSNNAITDAPFTLGSFYNYIVQYIRLCEFTAIQRDLDYHDYIDQSVYQKYVDKERIFLQKPEAVQKATKKYQISPQTYIDIRKELISNKGYEVDITECCKQDMDMYGISEIAHAYVKNIDGKAVVVDWILDSQCFIGAEDKVRPLSEDEQYEDFQLQELLPRLYDQKKGLYKDFVKDSEKSIFRRVK